MSLLPPLRKAASAVFLLLLSSAFDPARAQDEPRDDDDRMSAGLSVTSRQRVSSVSGAGLPTPLERAVDPETYTVGPGDAFVVSVGGPAPFSYTATVTPDGHLILPDAGSIRAAGISLARTRALAQSALERQYRNVNTEVSLSRPRQFYVHVTGTPTTAGRIIATAVDRVSDVVRRVYPYGVQPSEEDAEYLPSLRDITLRRADGAVHRVDLLRYYATGDVAFNPYLSDGDIISVSTYNPKRASVFVEGDVPHPDAYPYRAGDTLLDLLALASGTRPVESLGAVRILRRQGGGTVEPIVLNVGEVVNGTQPNIALEPLDQLFVMTPDARNGVVTVKGAVEYPGRYPIRVGETTLRDVILERAGGLEPNALPRASLLVRNPPRTLEEPQGDSTLAARQVLQSNLNFLSRAYFEQERAVRQQVPIDLEEALAADASPLYLQDGDEIIVPDDAKSVLVFGQVARPGYTAYLPGQTATDYISAAGGKTPLATEVWVVEAGTGRFKTAAGTVLEPGDAVFVDRIQMADTLPLQQAVLQEEQLRMQEANNRRQARIQTIQTVLQVVGLAASTVTTYILIREGTGNE